MKKEKVSEMATVVSDVVRRFSLFTYNWQVGFIHVIWEDDDHMADHLKNKFDQQEKNGVITSGGFMNWFMELDGDNQSKLITWIDENYKG